VTTIGLTAAQLCLLFQVRGGVGRKTRRKRQGEGDAWGFKGTDLHFRVILSKSVTLPFSITDLHIRDNN